MKNALRILLFFFATQLFAQNSQRTFQKIEFKKNLTIKHFVEDELSLIISKIQI